MSTKRAVFSALLAVLFVFTSFSGALAAFVTNNGVTIFSPDYTIGGPALMSCEPWAEPNANTITIRGVAAGETVELRFAWANPYTGTPNYQPWHYLTGTGGDLVVPVDYPMDTTQWPVFNTSTNERAIAIGALVIVKNGGVIRAKMSSKMWWVRCLPPLRLQGCTPGYWRQDQHFDSWAEAGTATSEDFETVFGVNASFNPDTLLDAVWLGGGGEFALARHAVAALLNARHPGVNYQFTEAQIIAGVQNAYATGSFEPFKTQLDFANNAGCPLN